MLAQVEPGEIRARLPAVAAGAAGAVRRRAPRPRRDPPPGRHALAAPALLRLLRSHRRGAGDPRGAARRDPELGRRSSGAPRRPRPSSRCTLLDWVAQLIGLPAGWHGHIEDTASTSTLAALIAARATRPGATSSSAPSTRIRRSRRPRRMLGMELRKVPADDAFRMRADALELDDAAAVVATVGTTSTTSVDPVAAIADRCAAGGHVAARRRRLRRLGDGLPRAPLGVRGRRPRRLARRQRRTSGCSRRWTARCSGRAGPTSSATRSGSSGVPAHDRRRRAQPQRVRPGARPPLPLAQALGGPALLRRARGCAADPRGDPARRAVRGLGARRARLGGLRAAAVLRRLLPAATGPTRRTRRSSSA